jgi:hypothetical protein
MIDEAKQRIVALGYDKKVFTGTIRLRTIWHFPGFSCKRLVAVKVITGALETLLFDDSLRFWTRLSISA